MNFRLFPLTSITNGAAVTLCNTCQRPTQVPALGAPGNKQVQIEKTRPRVLYMHQYFSTPELPGGSRSYELGRRLVQRGFDVTILTSDRSGSASQKELPASINGMKVIWLKSRYTQNMGFTRRVVAFFSFSIKASIYAISHSTDVIFATSTPLTIAIPAKVSHVLRRTPVVFEVRDSWPDAPIELGILRNPAIIKFAIALERMSYRMSDHIVALSPGMATRIIEKGVSPDKVHTIPNLAISALDSQETRSGYFGGRDEKLKGRRIALYLGSVGFIHGVDYLVDMARDFVDEQCAIVVMGGGSELASFLTRAREMGVLGRSLWWFPPVRKSEALEALSDCDVALSTVIDVPILEENSANKYFEALGAGKPIAINYGGWHRDLIESSGAGISLTRNPREGARRLTALLKNDSALTAASSSALTLAETIADPDRAADKLAALLKSAYRDIS